MRTIRIVDTTLRDGIQSLWATRMTTATMLPIAEEMDGAGFEAVDLMGNVHYDVCVRHLKESPWDRIRLMRARMPSTPLIQAIRSRAGIAFDFVPERIRALPRGSLVVTSTTSQDDAVIEGMMERGELRRDRKSTRLNSSHSRASRMPSSA